MYDNEDGRFHGFQSFFQFVSSYFLLRKICYVLMCPVRYTVHTFHQALYQRIKILIFICFPQQMFTTMKTMKKSPMNCGKKLVGSSSIRTSMKRVLCGSSLTVLMNLFRLVNFVKGFSTE